MRDEDLFKPLSAKGGGVSYASGGRALTPTQKRKSEDAKIRAQIRRGRERRAITATAGVQE